MKLLTKALIFLLVSTCFIACKTTRPSNASGDDGVISFNILQINDVYEIAPLEGGKMGGLARIATVKKGLERQNPNTLLIHAGDFLNPSLIGTMKYEGERISGKQMVEVMNAIKVDLVTFGNHEFDLDEKTLQKRLNESEFAWTSVNVQHSSGGKRQPFYRMKGGKKEYISEYYIWSLKDADGTALKIAFLGLTLPVNPTDYVYYEDYTQEAKRVYQLIKDSVDLVLAITHLEMEEDRLFAAALPGIPLILGGHDHEHLYEQVGPVRIAKADANAKSAYLHQIVYDKRTKEPKIDSELIVIDDKVQEDSLVAKLVSKWTAIADKSFREDGFDPYEVLTNAKEPLDGRESTIRNQQTNLGKLITTAMARAIPKSVDAAILNSGSIRLDDQLSGAITQFDIIRTLPFGGEIWEVEMTGNLLKQLLDAGLENKGTGGYLQWNNIDINPSLKQKWVIAGQPLSEKHTYRVALNNFLLSGREAGLEFLNEDNVEIKSITKGNPDKKSDLRNDMRLAVIAFLKAEK